MFNCTIYRILFVSSCFLFSFEARSQIDSTIEYTEETTTEHFQQPGYSDTAKVYERHLTPEQVNKLKNDKDFWYADTEPEKEKQEKINKQRNYTPLGDRPWFQTILWIVIIGGFLFALVWYLISNQVNLFRKKKDISQIAEEEEMPEDIFAINYQKEIDKAARQGNFRLAIRLMYLRLLKVLSDRDIIHYKNDLTNFDYLMQLQGSRHYQHFFRLTRHYEYSWYGHFDVNETQYGSIRTDFEQMDREVQQ
jgi:hypothetical protein